ncbi:hypothetical protein EJ04DRAFT_600611 [Polyplosphaeria fusca]|uniref:Uncharacterized protein n=1 Tax=Polyplosphaeria fusca TaxID=682080 RepID=A0A9P4RBE6_9PLEO|nr:hypothetical protein EJ04DRAFT_600611 [Polyplosphaeria fusca]
MHRGLAQSERYTRKVAKELATDVRVPGLPNREPGRFSHLREAVSVLSSVLSQDSRRLQTTPPPRLRLLSRQAHRTRPRPICRVLVCDPEDTVVISLILFAAPAVATFVRFAFHGPRSFPGSYPASTSKRRPSYYATTALPIRPIQPRRTACDAVTQLCK